MPRVTVWVDRSSHTRKFSHQGCIGSANSTSHSNRILDKLPTKNAADRHRSLPGSKLNWITLAVSEFARANSAQAGYTCCETQK